MAKVRFREAGAIRAFTEGETKGLMVLAMPFNTPDNLDRLGQWADARTDLMISIGERRPLMYAHGLSKYGGRVKSPHAIGYSEGAQVDSAGFWMKAYPDDSPLGQRALKAGVEGRAAASSGSIGHLVRPEYDRMTGLPPHGSHLETWAIAELSVWDREDGFVPVSDDAIVMPMRALYEASGVTLPEAFEAGEDKDAGKGVDAIRAVKDRRGMMDPEVKKLIAEASAEAVRSAMKEERDQQAEMEKQEEAMRVRLLKELGVPEDEAKDFDKAKHKYARSFNILPEMPKFRLTAKDQAQGLTLADKEETYAFYRLLFQAGRAVRDDKPIPRGWAAPHPESAERAALEESEAAEIGPMVPTEVIGQIKELRGKYSLVDRAGVTPLPVTRLTMSVPAETSSITELATIAEEGAYTDLQPAFAAKSATMLKKGGYVAVTEEALEDQTLFQAYLPRASAKSQALAQNTVLAGLLQSIDGVETAATHTITDAEIIGAYYALAQEYRDGAVWIMNDATLGYLRAKLVATPRAYGEFGFNPMSMGEAGEAFLNHPVFTNANWTSYASASDDEKVIDFVNLDEALSWGERRGLTIFVDPYSTRLAAGTINYLISSRFNGVVTNTAALSGIDDHA